jgi:hypothetical protein
MKNEAGFACEMRNLKNMFSLMHFGVFEVTLFSDAKCFGPDANYSGRGEGVILHPSDI